MQINKDPQFINNPAENNWIMKAKKLQEQLEKNRRRLPKEIISHLETHNDLLKKGIINEEEYFNGLSEKLLNAGHIGIIDNQF